MPARGVDGLAIWVPVRSEPEAQLVLASHGVAVATATESRTRPGPPAIRVATGIAIPAPTRWPTRSHGRSGPADDAR